MKKFIFIVLVNLLNSNISYSIEASIKGFIALDALNYKKFQNKKDSLNIGIGVLDLKVYAEQDDMTAAIKLNIDGNLSNQNALFEEAYATYRGIKNVKLTLGKGVVKFQNLHWGVVANTYQDGGSILDSENSWRKISNKALLSVAYGKKEVGFTNTSTIWGDSQEIQFDEKGNPKYITSGTATTKTISAYETKFVPAFTTQKQLGLANKFEYYQNQEWTLTTGQVYFKNKLQDKASYAIDFGAIRESTLWEYWLDVIHGFTSKAPFESFTTYRKNEFFIQSGVQYHLDQFWSVLTNLEYLHVKDVAHTYTTFTRDGIAYDADSNINKNGQTVISNSYKIEVGGQYKISKSSFITTGALYEKKVASRNGVENLTFIKGLFNANAEAYQLLSSISFWY